MSLNIEQCQQARLSRDARFDGKFYIAVKTTGIYCRPICPATAPKEQNVSYFLTAIEAANHGYRPCLRCRPDSAPGSFAFKGVDTTVERALKLIEQGALATGSVEALASRLGIGDRYLRLLFKDKLGTTPKQYALYQQLLFAKQLLHQSALSITDVAFSSGFNSLRRFNDSFKQHFALTPQQIRKQQKPPTNQIELILSYRPPYCWDFLKGFLSKRLIPELEWIDGDTYGRTFTYGIVSDDEPGQPLKGHFEATHLPAKNGFKITLTTNEAVNILPVVKNIRRILDLDTDVTLIEQQLAQVGDFKLLKGLRLPGIWDPFEAGIRAILGQQISVEAARKLVVQVTETYGEPYVGVVDGVDAAQQHHLFPGPQILAKVDFSGLKIPQSRKNTLMAFSQYCVEHPHYDNLDDWLDIKGIGPWTVNYAKMRGLSDTDIWLASDLGVKKALIQLQDKGDEESDTKSDIKNNTKSDFNSDAAKPWRSYLTFQCWNLLS